MNDDIERRRRRRHFTVKMRRLGPMYIDQADAGWRSASLPQPALRTRSKSLDGVLPPHPDFHFRPHQLGLGRCRGRGDCQEGTYPSSHTSHRSRMPPHLLLSSPSFVSFRSKDGSGRRYSILLLRRQKGGWEMEENFVICLLTYFRPVAQSWVFMT
jgi:hypothetical protein